jgi:hypothetical protein
VGSVWSRQGKLLAPDGLASDAFGVCVTIYGTVAMIGAWNVDTTLSNIGMLFSVIFIIL